ncbi:MAG: PQQ-binding-like beta-propeller repeat protein, partial [Candidatus Zixiibacteriota bacterium]
FGFVDRLYPPVVAYDRAYIQVGNFGASLMTGFDLGTGDSLWSTHFIEQFGNRLSPTIWNGQIVCGSGYDGGMECFDAYSGQAVWQRSTNPWQDWTPAIHDGKVYTFLNGIFAQYDISNGSLAWSISVVGAATNVNYPCTGYLMGTAPVLDTVNQIAYLMWHEYFTAVDLKTRSILWKNWGNFGCGINPSICNGRVFAIDSGIFKCLDGQTGGELWRHQLADTSFEYPPIVANGYVYVSGGGKTVALSLTSHEEVWRCDYGGYLAIAGNMLYIAGQDGWLIAFQQENTTEVAWDENPSHDFYLYHPFPNPFNPTTRIYFDLKVSTTVTMVVYDILGRKVKTLLDHESWEYGRCYVNWMGDYERGNPAPSGVYFFKLTTPEFEKTVKAIKMK